MCVSHTAREALRTSSVSTLRLSETDGAGVSGEVRSRYGDVVVEISAATCGAVRLVASSAAHARFWVNATA